MRYDMTSSWNVAVPSIEASGATSSRNLRAQAMTRAPRVGSYGPGAAGRSPSASVP